MFVGGVAITMTNRNLWWWCGNKDFILVKGCFLVINEKSRMSHAIRYIDPSIFRDFNFTNLKLNMPKFAITRVSPNIGHIHT